MTPSVRTTVIKSTGLCDMALTKYENDTSIYDTCLALGRKPPGPVGTGNGGGQKPEGQGSRPELALHPHGRGGTAAKKKTGPQEKGAGLRGSIDQKLPSAPGKAHGRQFRFILTYQG